MRKRTCVTLGWNVITVQISPDFNFVFFWFASFGVIPIEKCLVLLYSSTISSKKRKVHKHIFLRCPVPPFCDARFLLVLRGIKGYKFLYFFVIKFVPFMDHNFSGFLSLNIFSNALATSYPVLLFRGFIQPYFQKTSIAVKRYFTPLLYFWECFHSDEIGNDNLSNTFNVNSTFQNFLITGLLHLCNSSASWSVHFTAFFDVFTYLSRNLLLFNHLLAYIIFQSFAETNLWILWRLW